MVNLQEIKARSSPNELQAKNAQINQAVAKKLLVIIVVCLIFMILEILGGILSNSLALVSDAFHLMTDLVSFLISLLSTYLAQHKPSKRMNFGFKRVEVLGALMNIILIWVLTGVLLYLAIIRIVYAAYEIETNLMITMASIGVLINGVMAFILSYNNKSHSHHSHGKKVAPKDGVIKQEELDDQVSKNINIRAAFIHVLGDMIQSIGVLIASLIIYINPAFKIADPICTILFSIIVLFTTISILGDILNVLSESFPVCLDYDSLEKLILSSKGVKKVYDLKCWYLSTDSFALNAHLLVLDSSNQNAILDELKSNLTKLNIEHINIQFEFINLKQFINRYSS